jgi:hypothetical protein
MPGRCSEIRFFAAEKFAPLVRTSSRRKILLIVKIFGSNLVSTVKD